MLSRLGDHGEDLADLIQASGEEAAPVDGCRRPEASATNCSRSRSSGSLILSGVAGMGRVSLDRAATDVKPKRPRTGHQEGATRTGRAVSA